MAMNKKGMFFTVAAIALSFILILSFNTEVSNELSRDINVIETRIITMNNFIKDIEQDLEKGLQITSFRAFASMGQHITNNGTFITDVDASFDELVLEGTLDGNVPSLMEDSTFVDWTNKIEQQAQSIDINVRFNITDVMINQSDPWNVDIISIVNITLNDTKGTSSWSRTKTIVAVVSIEDFEDPLYIVNSNGKVTNTIRESPITQFTSGPDTTNLMDHTNNSYYIVSASAPNYLQRLEGDLGNSSVGIESLVNVQELIDQSISALDRSVVDYIYFGNQTTTDNRINNTPDWFRIDNGHLSTYQVTGLVI